MREWCAGALPYGSWAAHCERWVRAARQPGSSILLLRYEDGISGLEDAWVRKIIQHLGLDIADARRKELLSFMYVNFQWFKNLFQYTSPVPLFRTPRGQLKRLLGASEEVPRSLYKVPGGL
jgi:hypothetical protein